MSIPENRHAGNRIFFFAILTLGISSMITQITLFRELLNVSGGSEIILGYSLSLWFLLTGVGTFFAGASAFRNRRQGVLIAALAAAAVLPVVHLALLRIVPVVLAPPGAVPEMRTLLISLPFLMAPYCLAAGGVLVQVSGLLKKDRAAHAPAAVYLADNIGDISGGVLYSFGLVFVLSTLHALFVPFLLNIAAAVMICIRFRWIRTAVFIAAAAVGFAALCFFVRLDRVTVSALYPGQEIVRFRESRYGRVVVTRDREQVNVFENNVPVFSTASRRPAETGTHIPLSLLPRRPLKILLVSGGFGGALEEIRKYNPARVDYVDLDPEIIRTARLLGMLPPDPRIHVHIADGREFVEQSSQQYDAVILRLPPPENLQLNRFYTREFFAEVRAILSPDGILSFSLPGYGNYIPDELSGLYSAVNRAVHASFAFSFALPVEETLFLCSDRNYFSPPGALISRITKGLSGRGISAEYVNSYYLGALLTPDRLKELQDHVRPGDRENRDLYPTAYRMQIRYWLAYYNLDIRVLLIGFSAAGILFLLLYGPVQTVMWSTGLAAAGCETVLLMLFQIASGYVYSRFGIAVTLFMAGLALGSFIGNRWIRRAFSPDRCRRMLFGFEAGLVLTVALLWVITSGTRL